VLTTHNKILKAQIAEQVSSSPTPSGRLPSKPKLNPMEQCNAIVLRSGTQLEGSRGAKVEMEGTNDHNKGVYTLPSKGEVQEKSKNDSSRDSKFLSLKLYIPPLPFAKAKLNS